MLDEATYQKTISLVLDSLFLVMELNKMLYHNKSDKVARITQRAWCRHWRRVQMANKLGITELTIPSGAVDLCNQ